MSLQYARTQQPDQERLWNAFLSRDRSFDGVFICAVRSTRHLLPPDLPRATPAPVSSEVLRLPR